MRKTKANVPYRRKREGRTDYKLRMRLLMAEKPKLVVRKSSRGMQMQLVQYDADGDKVLACAHSRELVKLGWQYSQGSIPASYLTGYLIGKKMLAKGYKETILDLGLQAKGQRIFAALKGTIDAGVKVPAEEKVFPSQERLSGEHIKTYKGQGAQFAALKKANIDQGKISEQFKQVKEKIK